jgi:nucleoside permease NupC
MIRPFLAKLTNSEIHAIMTGGFATIAGGVLAAYVKIGVIS